MTSRTYMYECTYVRTSFILVWVCPSQGKRRRYFILLPKEGTNNGIGTGP